MGVEWLGNVGENSTSEAEVARRERLGDVFSPKTADLVFVRLGVGGLRARGCTIDVSVKENSREDSSIIDNHKKS
jgi:hypothetical protein